MKTVTDLEILEDLEFSTEQACEHEQHSLWHGGDDRAVMYVRRLACPQCNYVNPHSVIALCQSGWDKATPPAMLICGACTRPDFRDTFWRYLGPVNP
jgi:hypothetical protein